MITQRGKWTTRTEEEEGEEEGTDQLPLEALGGEAPRLELLPQTDDR